MNRAWSILLLVVMLAVPGAPQAQAHDLVFGFYYGGAIDPSNGDYWPIIWPISEITLLDLGTDDAEDPPPATYVAPDSDSEESVDPPGIPGDGNGDGRVDIGDFTLWGARDAGGDYNDDGAVDIGDFIFWESHFGSSIDPPTTITTLTSATPIQSLVEAPEPAVRHYSSRGIRYDWGSFNPIEVGREPVLLAIEGSIVTSAGPLAAPEPASALLLALGALYLLTARIGRPRR